jgi:hypothetical protein
MILSEHEVVCQNEFYEIHYWSLKIIIHEIWYTGSVQYFKWVFVHYFCPKYL